MDNIFNNILIYIFSRDYNWILLLSMWSSAAVNIIKSIYNSGADSSREAGYFNKKKEDI